MVPNVSRRKFLQLSVGSGVVFSGCLVNGAEFEPTSRNPEPLTEHYGGHPVKYQHDGLRLSVASTDVQPGGTFRFEVENTSTSEITLGCGNPWTLQKFRDGEWRDVIWTTANGFPTCATPLPAGETRTEAVTVEREELASQTESVREDLTHGRYRVVLLSTEPFLAEEFRVRSA